MDDREDFEKWMMQWAEAEKELAQETNNHRADPEPQRPDMDMSQLRTSYFTGTPSSYDYEDSGDGPADDWYDIYHRAMDIDYSSDGGLLTDSAVNVAYMGSEGYGKEVVLGKTATGGKKAYTNNPIAFSSVGNDQEDEEGHVRVTDNWSDGVELRELDEVKKRVEQMERRVHESDVLKKSQRSKLEGELKDLRERVKKLSQRVTSSPQDDLT